MSQYGTTTHYHRPYHHRYRCCCFYYTGRYNYQCVTTDTTFYNNHTVLRPPVCVCVCVYRATFLRPRRYVESRGPATTDDRPPLTVYFVDVAVGSWDCWDDVVERRRKYEARRGRETRDRCRVIVSPGSGCNRDYRGRGLAVESPGLQRTSYRVAIARSAVERDVRMPARSPSTAA